jgi:capsular polysaccharide biosynthesis protein
LTQQSPEAAAALPLRFVDDKAEFARVESLDALLAPVPQGCGLRWIREDEGCVDPLVLAAWRSPRVGGGSVGTWHPAGGALIGLDGALPAATVAEIFFNKPRLDPLAAVEPVGDGLVFNPPVDAPGLGEVCVAFPWGVVNYGHFLLDGMTCVLAMREAGALDRLPLATPPLRRWQRDLLRLAFEDLAWQEVEGPIVRIAGAVYSPAMDHYLHRPGPLLMRLRARLLAVVQDTSPIRSGFGRRKLRLYVSRRGQSMRVMVNEIALEAALIRRGFQIVRPERMKVADQIALFADAETIVGPSGAGMANAMFAPEGCKVVEIQPENFASFWVPAICRLIGLDWGGYIAPSPCEPKAAPWLLRLRRGFRFAYRLDVADFLAFLDRP